MSLLSVTRCQGFENWFQEKKTKKMKKLKI